MEVRPAATPVVIAAGGVVYRTVNRHIVEYAIVHRPAYDDWSLPKGKLQPGETEEEAAVREVEEETGMRCRIVRALGTTSYIDRKGRPKVVYYWLMRAVTGKFAVNGEIDDLRWEELGPAIHLLSYDRDRTLLRALGEHHEE
jgi:8-oxo-dGTP pyrophosphatase MutT (NUDIX family)